jgi:serine/threonine-protein kinase
VLGTASYISPEQAMGEQATPLSDVYALGVVAYQCLAGRRPFEGENPLEIAMRHVREAPPPLPPDIPPPVRVIVERAMAKQPAARWPNASAFGAVARRAAAELAAAGPAPVAPPAPPGRPGPVSGLPTGAPVTPVPGTRVLSNTGGRAPAPTPPGYLRSQQLPGYLQQPVQPPKRGMSPGLLVAIIVAVVLVAICFGAGIAILQQNTNAQSMARASGSLSNADFEGRQGR